jgi:putative glutamine amidotransferase
MEGRGVMNDPVIGITMDIKGEHLRLKCYYSDAIIKAGGIPLLIPLSDDALIYVEKIDGLLVPGGGDLNPLYYNEIMMPQVKVVPRQKSDFEISLLRGVINLHKPILGICYGMQLINVALGGTIYQDIESQVSSGINHRKGYHTVVVEENKFLKKGEFSVNSTHHQAVKELGAGIRGLAFSPDKLIEAFYGTDYPFLVGVQWHPERLMNDSLSLELFRSFIEKAKKNR